MRWIKFLLLAVGILLLGAFAARTAANMVVAPRSGETVSAGVVSVPSVLGQSAGEALFYPWPLYETQELRPLPDLVLDNYASVFGAMEALGVSYDAQALRDSMLWNADNENFYSQVNVQLFLKDFPTVLVDSSEPVTLDFAYSPSGYRSISYLVRPQDGPEPAGEQQNAALEKVKADLAELWFMSWCTDWSENGMAQLLSGFMDYYAEADGLREFSMPMESLFRVLRDSAGAMFRDFYQEVNEDPLSTDSTTWDKNSVPIPPLEDVLAWLERINICTVQLISTPRHIVVLISFNLNAKDGRVFGIYYDIQLQRYSGFGMTF